MYARTLARPYARALLKAIQPLATPDLSSVENWLKALAFALGQADLSRQLRRPGLDAEHVLEVIAAALPYPSPIAKRFLTELVYRRRLELLPTIATLFSELIRVANAVRAVQIESAVALPDDVLEHLHQILIKKLGHDLCLSTAVNPSLIGGFRVTLADQVLDLSVCAQLKALLATVTH